MVLYADTRVRGRIPRPRPLAELLKPAPVDDPDIRHAVDLGGPHQPMRLQLVDHAIVFYGVAGKRLHADDSGPQWLHAEIISEVL